GENSFELDSIGRIKKLKDYKNRVLKYGWNEVDERDYIIYPDGSKVDYEYDEMGRIAEVTGMDNTVKYEYNVLGKVKKQILPDGTTTNYSYNSSSKILELNSIRENKIIDRREFSYDKTGNKINIKINGDSINYKYDKMNQLIEEIKFLSNNQPGNITKYFYDTLGNRVKIEDSNGDNKPKITNYSYDKNEHLIGINGKRTNIFGSEEFLTQGINLKYDKRGNFVKAISGNKILGELEFDETNRLNKFTNSEEINTNFSYDGFDRRIKVNENDFVCDITKIYNSVIQSEDSKYIYGNGISPIISGKVGENSFFVKDELDSSISLIKENGFIEKQAFDTFGNLKDNYNISSTNKNLFSYTGYQNDGIGLLYAQARYYLPEIGKYISEDSYKGQIIDIQSLNNSVYCNNNPLRFIDPSGYVPCGEYQTIKPVDGTKIIRIKEKRETGWDKFKKIFEFEAGLGSGLGVSTKLFNVLNVELGGYIDRINFRYQDGKSDLSSKIDVGLDVEILKNLKVGGDYYVTNNIFDSKYNDPFTGIFSDPNAEKSWMYGIKTGNKSLIGDNSLKDGSEDFKIPFGVSVAVGVAGQA
ncbi:MAG: RHS repeat-associated core domain-containing protein, partial [Clostridiales bacterium]